MLLKKLCIPIIGVLSIFTTQHTYASDSIQSDYLKIGGALRFNTVVENYENSNKALNSYLKLDTWFLTADAHKLGFDLSLQYRFYDESKTHFIHHAYIGYRINEKWYTKLGVFQKPFGVGDFASHSWWFQVPYYMGLEDTYNTGVGAFFSHNKLKFDFAYFRQAAPKGSISSNSEDNAVGNGRYSYAVVSTIGYADGKELIANIRELNQVNTRLRYQVLNELEIGASLQLGDIYNRELDKHKLGLTWAVHTLANVGNWNFKGEVISYNYNAIANNGSHLDVLQMAAYGSAYDVATKGNIYVAGLSYTIPINRKFIQSIQPYLDYSVVDKRKKGFTNTQQFVPGMLITMGPVYTYIDYAMGKNHPWLTSNFGEGLGVGSKDASWNGRLNINIGYYFNQ